jgi:hypothetical protein
VDCLHRVPDAAFAVNADCSCSIDILDKSLVLGILFHLTAGSLLALKIYVIV